MKLGQPAVVIVVFIAVGGLLDQDADLLVIE